MGRSPARRTRALLSWLVALAAVVPGAAAPAAPGPTPSRWAVTVAIRIAGGGADPVTIRLALPADTEAQQVGPVEVTARGLDSSVVRDAPQPYVLLSGRLKGARRVAVRYSVSRRRQLAAVPAVLPVTAPPPELLPYLSPSPVFQSRSLLVRDFLETYVSPALGTASNTDLMRAIFQVTREKLTWDRAGKSLTLDVIRSGKGKRIGIERAFVTFLRCAHIPARLVEGVNLNSTTRRKRVFWTEVWTQGRWWPVSASRGWIGREPKSYVALTRDGQRVLTVDGPVDATYSIQAVPEEGKT
jgi:transglutaminase-like putative cysteine protease